MSSVNSFHIYQKMRCVLNFMTNSFVIKHSIFVLIISIPCMFCFIFFNFGWSRNLCQSTKDIYLFVNIESFMLNILFIVECRCFNLEQQETMLCYMLIWFFCSCVSCVLYDKCGHISFHYLLSNQIENSVLWHLNIFILPEILERINK